MGHNRISRVVHTILKRRIIDQNRRDLRRTRPSEWHDGISGAETSDTFGPNESARDRISAAMAGLTEQQQQVLYLFEVVGLPDTEIATRLEIPAKRVRVIRYRAKAKLLELLGGEWPLD